MDNPQHYQPLSHALNPPIVQPQYEEEEEGEDEGAVEEQLEREDDDGDEYVSWFCVYMYMGQNNSSLRPHHDPADQTVLINRHPLRMEQGSSALTQHPPFRRNHPARQHLKMLSANDAPVDPVAQKTGVFVDPVRKEMRQPRVPQL